MHRIISLAIALLFCQISFSQVIDTVNLLTIDSVLVGQDEFERIYTKNNQNPAFDKASLEEYMELFVNFKLKVHEAESLGLDTASKFINELKGYRAQLEKPYLTTPGTDKKLIEEAYGRMAYIIKASHILIRSSYSDLPADTLKAYNKIKDIRAMALKKNADFGVLAKKYSEDEGSAKVNGELGYFSAFSMVYPFESAAYNTEVGEVSKIARTKFGYHIIKVYDRKENPGEIKVAHIMRSTPRGCSQAKIDLEKKTIYQVYDSLIEEVSFSELAAKYSEDKGTSAKGGELPFFGMGRMIPVFEKAAYSLKGVGQFTKPIQTSYGWHIIKLLEQKKLGPIDDLEAYIKNRISKDIRAQKGRNTLISQLKKEYNFSQNTKALEPFYSIVDSTILTGSWNIENAKGLNEVLFLFNDSVSFTQADFANKLASNMKRSKNHMVVIVDQEYKRFVEKAILDYERSILETKYPDFKHLLKEYHDGILLFNLSDEMVWSKAVKDTAGLRAFHEGRKNDYMWGDRVEATIYTFSNKLYADNVMSIAAKVGKKNGDYNKALSKLTKKALAKDSTFTISASKAKFSKGDNELVDSLGWETGNIQLVESSVGMKVIYINSKVSPEPKLLSESRGLITADYQTYLEEEWIAKLREKYEVVINEDVFLKMIK